MAADVGRADRTSSRGSPGLRACRAVIEKRLASLAGLEADCDHAATSSPGPRAAVLVVVERPFARCKKIGGVGLRRKLNSAERGRRRSSARIVLKMLHD
ncbi:MAG: hypothetical protein KGQ28_03280 [Hyphomicrobiales bacterium]|nr:hypothetical protein [Hyphomicrobiales bacterium]